MSPWRTIQLTSGTAVERYHSHSYYDIPVFDSSSRYVAAYETTFSERQPTSDDLISIGVIDTESGDPNWTPIGESTAWSWQQGPMAQWVPGFSTLMWNDRVNDSFVTRLWNMADGTRRILDRSSYTVDPNARFTLSLNMARLNTLRPGYGYADGLGAQLSERRPTNDGVWKQDLASGSGELVLSLDRAVEFLLSKISRRQRLKHRIKRFHYWFNHAKLSPSGQRFTVKLRFRQLFGDWSDEQGVSLTCAIDGADLRLLAPATSHVIWLDNTNLYFWQRNGFYIFLDTAPEGCRVRQIAPSMVGANAHLRYFPGETTRFLFDTPYLETIELYEYHEDSASYQTIGRFNNHRPRHGPYRCDLHPCPSPDRQKIVVTSLQDGGRQVYLLYWDPTDT